MQEISISRTEAHQNSITKTLSLTLSKEFLIIFSILHIRTIVNECLLLYLIHNTTLNYFQLLQVKNIANQATESCLKKDKQKENLIRFSNKDSRSKFESLR